jgi:hypothetical protein
MKEIDYFLGCKSDDEAKKRFKVLSKKLHPDMPAGDTKQFQKLLEQYMDFNSTGDQRFNGVFERFIDFLFIFRNCFQFKKIDNEWAIVFSDFIEWEYFTNLGFTLYFGEWPFSNIEVVDGCLVLKLSDQLSRFVSGSIYIHQFIKMSNQ